jgi:hypothetical protein
MRFEEGYTKFKITRQRELDVGEKPVSENARERSDEDR